MNMYILTEGRTFKTFLKENDAISLDSCYLFTKNNVEHGFEHDTDSAYGVYTSDIPELYSRFDEYLVI